jgi:Protein of unknown function (DUF1302)
MRQAKVLLWGLPVVLMILAAQSTWAQEAQNFRIGPFEITGFYQYTIYPAAEVANPNNFACLSGTCKPGLQQRAGRPNFILMRQLLDLNIFGKFSDNWSVTMEPRFFFDMTKIADNHLRQYESLPDPFPGNGWMLRGGGNDFKAEMWQAYVDYKNGDWWVRFGKQQIAWGEALGLRVLDIVNPLDLSQNLAFDRIYEEFDRVRIPQWFVRADYTIPTASIPDLTAEFILNPGIVVPTIFPPQGSPLNVVPALLQIRDHVKQGEPTVGGRVTGTVGEAQFSVNFVTKPNDNPIGVFKFIPPAGVTLGCASPPFNPTDCQVVLGARHPRIYIVGGSANYNWNEAGAVLRAETTVTTNSPLLRSVNGTPLRIIDRAVWKMMLGIDRPTYVIPGLDSMTIGLQFLETFTGGDLHHVADSAGTAVDKTVQQFTIFFQQPLLSKRISLEFFGMLDTGDGYWLQPGVHWEFGDHIRLDAFYNHFAGSLTKAPGARFGGDFSFANGPFFRFTYGF